MDEEVSSSTATPISSPLAFEEHKLHSGHPRRLLTAKEEKDIHIGLAERHGVTRWRLQAKLDAFVVLPICLLYLLAFLDRVNVSNANAYGMAKDLNISSFQWNIALAVFFPPYIVFEIPANWMLKFLKPHVWLGICLVCFGAVSIGQGFVKNFHELIVTRVLLGFLETSMFPSCFYLLGQWYTRSEAQKRYTFFFASTSLAGAFAGLIAYGMNTIDGKLGIKNWQWIFIVEGAITSACGVILFFLIADFPEDAKFLSENERNYVKEKLALDQGDSLANEKVGLKDIGRVFLDWKLYLSGFMYFGAITGAYGFAYFAPQIIHTFGYTSLEVQVHSIYPWIAAFGFSILVAVYSDFMRHRFAFAMFTAIVAVVGYGLILGTEPIAENRHIRYAALFLIAPGLYAFMPIVVCWSAMNFGGHSRKMVATAYQVGFANTGGIISTFIYRTKDAPGYRLGLWVSLGILLFGMGSTVTYFLGVMYTNKYRRQGKADAWWAQLSETDRLKAGDLDPAWVYMY